MPQDLIVRSELISDLQELIADIPANPDEIEDEDALLCEVRERLRKILDGSPSRPSVVQEVATEADPRVKLDTTDLDPNRFHTKVPSVRVLVDGKPVWTYEGRDAQSIAAAMKVGEADYSWRKDGPYKFESIEIWWPDGWCRCFADERPTVVRRTIVPIQGEYAVDHAV